MNEQPQETSEQTEGQEGLSTADIGGAAERSGRPPAGPEAQAGPVRPSPAREAEQAGPAMLFSPEDADRYRACWESTQASFVDDPRKATQEADQLVADVIKQLAERFADERSKLEQEWSRGQDVSTEDLRLALRHYRSFFDRLLSM